MDGVAPRHGRRRRRPRAGDPRDVVRRVPGDPRRPDDAGRPAPGPDAAPRGAQAVRRGGRRRGCRPDHRRADPQLAVARPRTPRRAHVARPRRRGWSWRCGSGSTPAGRRPGAACTIVVAVTVGVVVGLARLQPGVRRAVLLAARSGGAARGHGDLRRRNHVAAPLATDDTPHASSTSGARRRSDDDHPAWMLAGALAGAGVSCSAPCCSPSRPRPAPVALAQLDARRRAGSPRGVAHRGPPAPGRSRPGCAGSVPGSPTP